MKQKNILVSVSNDLFTDQRVDKVCSFLVEKGGKVTLIGRKLPESKEVNRNYKTVRMRLPFRKGALFYASLNIALFFRILFSKADILVSNDLDTLPANYFASKFKRNCILFYDTHEYYTEVPELINRPKIKRIWERIEAYIFPKLKHIYTVNESIAERYSTKYNKQIAVVRNVSPNYVKTNKTRTELGLPEHVFLIIAQGAGINVDRGIEELVDAMLLLEQCNLAIVGDGDVVSELKLKVETLNLSERVLFFGKRPYAEMMEFTQNADLGVSLDKDTNLNYRFSLPNKIFDYMHAGIPLFVSELPEIIKIISKYNCGIIAENHAPETLAKQIEAFRLDVTKQALLKSNSQKAALIENWETETVVLTTIYSNFL